MIKSSTGAVYKIWPEIGIFKKYKAIDQNFYMEL